MSIDQRGDATDSTLGAGGEARYPERPQAACPDWSIASDAAGGMRRAGRAGENHQSNHENTIPTI
ncbi:hypothetical protein [Haladaptatus sp. NG-SE-30]